LILLVELVECIFIIATGCWESPQLWNLCSAQITGSCLFSVLAALHIRSTALYHRNCREVQ